MMDIRTMNIDKLMPANYNPRKDLKKGDPEYDRLKKAIQEFDYIDPIIWNERTGRIVGGHQRAKILKEMGRTEVEVSVVNVDEDKEKALNIALNKTGGDWDYVKLKDLLVEIDTGAFDIEITGFGEYEIERLLTQFDEPKEIIEDDFDADAAAGEIVNPITNRGDVWKLGRHRVMCGDSTSDKDVLVLMNGKKADMVFTDPPYGVNYQSNMRTKSDKFDILKNDNIILDFLPNVEIASTGFVFICTTWKVLDIWLELFSKYFELSNMIIWDKGGGGIGDLKKTFSTDYEIIMCSHRGKEIVGKRIGSVWTVGKDNANDYIHPTQKPIELPALAIKETTYQNAKVLDFFGGSGSTLMACEQTGRMNYSMELDPKYCDVIIKRWETFTGQKAVRISGEDQGRTTNEADSRVTA